MTKENKTEGFKFSYTNKQKAVNELESNKIIKELGIEVFEDGR